MAVFSLRRVLASLLPLASLPCLVSASASSTSSLASGNSSDVLSQLPIEIDVIFPRSQNYTATEILPIAISVQHLTPQLRDKEDWYITWGLRVHDPGDLNLTRVVDYFLDSGFFDYDATIAGGSNDSDNAILVSYSNITEWIGYVNYTSQIVLTVGTVWNITGMCDRPMRTAMSFWEGLFGMHVPGQVGYEPSDDSTPVGDALARASACPEFGFIAEAAALSSTLVLSREGFQGPYLPMTTDYTTCSSYISYDTNPLDGAPCSVTVDAEIKSSIGSIASSRATSASSVSSVSSASSASAQAASLSSLLHPAQTSSPAAANAKAPFAPALAVVAAVYCVVYY